MAPNTDIATRAFVVGLKCSGKTTHEVSCVTGVSARQVNRIYARAIERGFDPARRPVVIKDDFLKDAPRSGRPPKQTRARGEKTRADGNGTGGLRLEGSSVMVWRVSKRPGAAGRDDEGASVALVPREKGRALGAWKNGV